MCIRDSFKNADEEVKDVTSVNKKHIVSVKYTQYAEQTTRSTNIAVAAFTTAHARVKLYNLLEKLGQRVLYCDTDSVIFVTRAGEDDPATGKFLGDLTDEIGSGVQADAFVCTGPKSYAVRLLKQDGSIDHILKAKGLTLN